MDYDLLLVGVVIYCRFAINSDSGIALRGDKNKLRK